MTFDIPIIAFDKLDGSNIRAEWSPKAGLHRFGTRRQLIDPEKSGILAKAPELILNKYGNDLHGILSANGYASAVCFFEFHGPGSFAGQHVENDHHDVTLFDVAPFTKGILPPEEFLERFGHLDVPKVLHRGEVTDEFIVSVRESKLAGMTFEGVVCKSANSKRTKQPIMFKLKSYVWLDRLREKCAGNETLFRSLA